MNSKALVVLLIISLLFSHPAFAKGLHFGIISAIESEIDKLEQKKLQKQAIVVQTTTDSSGEVLVHDEMADQDVVIRTTDASTGTPVGVINIKYVNTGTNIICEATDPSNQYYPNISITPVEQSSIIIPALIIIGLYAWSVGTAVHEFTTDPPEIETIPSDRGLRKVCLRGDLNDVFAIGGLVPILNIPAKLTVTGTKAIVAVLTKVDRELLKFSLKKLGVDLDQDYEFCYYETIHGIPVGPCFIIDKIIPPGTADITLTITPSIFYIGVEVEVTYTVRESNGIGVDLNYAKTTWYDEQGNLYREDEWQGQEAQDMFDDIWGTHYLPPNGTLEGTVSDAFIATETPGRMVMTGGGTDDNGNFVTDSWEGEVRA